MYNLGEIMNEALMKNAEEEFQNNIKDISIKLGDSFNASIMDIYENMFALYHKFIGEGILSADKNLCNKYRSILGNHDVSLKSCDECYKTNFIDIK